MPAAFRPPPRAARRTRRYLARVNAASPTAGHRRFGGLAAYAWCVLAYNLAVVAWGAFVRATGSGAGCGSHWPLCNGEVVPREPAIETLIELTHRLTSGLAAVAVFLLAWLVFRACPRGDPARRVAIAAALLMVIEALLGAGLVLFGWVEDDASWGRVASLGLHLMNTFVLLAAIALTAWRLSGGPANRWRTGTRESTLVALTLGLMLAVGITGAMTALGDTLFPSTSLTEGIRQDFVATSHFLVRLRVIHPALALITALVVLFSASALARRRPTRATISLARLTRTLIVLQVIGGFANLALLAPTWMQLVHLLLADLTWLSLVLLGAAALAPDPP